MSEAAFYILASERNGTLYCGSTDDLARRIWEHKNGIKAKFTTAYNVHTLVYYEHYDILMDARSREYKVKKWQRTWKLDLIESMNTKWKDLYFDLNK